MGPRPGAAGGAGGERSKSGGGMGETPQFGRSRGASAKKPRSDRLIEQVMKNSAVKEDSGPLKRRKLDDASSPPRSPGLDRISKGLSESSKDLLSLWKALDHIAQMNSNNTRGISKSCSIPLSKIKSSVQELCGVDLSEKRLRQLAGVATPDLMQLSLPEEKILSFGKPSTITDSMDSLQVQMRGASVMDGNEITKRAIEIARRLLAAQQVGSGGGGSSSSSSSSYATAATAAAAAAVPVPTPIKTPGKPKSKTSAVTPGVTNTSSDKSPPVPNTPALLGEAYKNKVTFLTKQLEFEAEAEEAGKLLSLDCLLNKLYKYY